MDENSVEKVPSSFGETFGLLCNLERELANLSIDLRDLQSRLRDRIGGLYVVVILQFLIIAAVLLFK